MSDIAIIPPPPDEWFVSEEKLIGQKQNNALFAGNKNVFGGAGFNQMANNNPFSGNKNSSAANNSPFALQNNNFFNTNNPNPNPFTNQTQAKKEETQKSNAQNNEPEKIQQNEKQKEEEKVKEKENKTQEEEKKEPEAKEKAQITNVSKPLQPEENNMNLQEDTINYSDSSLSPIKIQFKPIRNDYIDFAFYDPAQHPEDQKSKSSSQETDVKTEIKTETCTIHPRNLTQEEVYRFLQKLFVDRPSITNEEIQEEIDKYAAEKNNKTC